MASPCYSFAGTSNCGRYMCKDVKPRDVIAIVDSIRKSGDTGMPICQQTEISKFVTVLVSFFGTGTNVVGTVRSI